MTANATITATGERVTVTLLDPRFAYGRQAVITNAVCAVLRVPFSAITLDEEPS